MAPGPVWRWHPDVPREESALLGTGVGRLQDHGGTTVVSWSLCLTCLKMKIAQNGNVNVENDDQSSKFGILIILPNNYVMLKIDWKIIEFGWLIILDRCFCGATSCPFYLCRIGNRSLMEDEKHSKTKYLIVDTGDDLTASLSADIQDSPWSIACGWPVLGELGTFVRLNI